MEKEEKVSNIDDIDTDNKSSEELTETQDKSLQDKNSELEDKVIRLLADMENQRRRFEKEKDEAFEYGGFAFAKETLNLLDNLERSKISLQNDEALKDTDALKKLIEHINIINDDMISIFKKNKHSLSPTYHDWNAQNLFSESKGPQFVLGSLFCLPIWFGLIILFLLLL